MATNQSLQLDQSLFQLSKSLSKFDLSESDRVHLVISTVLGTLNGIDSITDLSEVSDGKSLLSSIDKFLETKGLSPLHREYVINPLSKTVESVRLKEELPNLYSLIHEYIKPIITSAQLHDFAGKLFNVMYQWVGFTQDKENDVVLTPPYVATLMARLARVDMNSYVWDLATGSAGLLLSAMQVMSEDAEKKLTGEELQKKLIEIKGKQILGLEVLPDVYMLAILNMLLMDIDLSSFQQSDSLKNDSEFQATAFVLNPPYSADGCGMVFVEKALNKMKTGYASILIQNSAGTGKAKEFNKRILQNNSLLASIKMPADLFAGKASVQTYMYIFKVGTPHNPEDNVKFIDFSNDGYKRTNRKSAVNLRDIDNAEARYKELVDIVVNDGKPNLLSVYENVIDVTNGADWNQTAPVDIRVTEDDIRKTITEYLMWELQRRLKEFKF